METCRKNIKLFNLLRHLNFGDFMLKFACKDKDRTVVFDTSMEKEIFEQPKVVENLIEDYIEGEFDFQVNSEIKKVKLVASGSSYHCARYGADLFGKVADIEARAIYSSEFLLKPKVPSSIIFCLIFSILSDIILGDVVVI